MAATITLTGPQRDEYCRHLWDYNHDWVHSWDEPLDWGFRTASMHVFDRLEWSPGAQAAHDAVFNLPINQHIAFLHEHWNLADLRLFATSDADDRRAEGERLLPEWEDIGSDEYVAWRREISLIDRWTKDWDLIVEAIEAMHAGLASQREAVAG